MGCHAMALGRQETDKGRKASEQETQLRVPCPKTYANSSQRPLRCCGRSDATWGPEKSLKGDWREGQWYNDGMRQSIKRMLRERWVLTASCRVVLVLDHTQSRNSRHSRATAAATVEARLGSSLCLSLAPVARVMLTQRHRFGIPYLHPIFLHRCLAQVSQFPANQNGNRKQRREKHGI